MRESGVKFRTEGESALLKAVNSVDRSLEAVAKQARASATQFEELTSSVKRATKIDGLTDKITLQNRQLELLQDKLKKASDTYGTSSEQAKKAQLAVDTLTTSIRQNERAVAALRAEDEKERKALDDKRTAIDAERQSLESRKSSLQAALDLSRRNTIAQEQQSAAMKAAQVVAAAAVKQEEARTKAAEKLEASLQKERAAYLASVVAKAKSGDAAAQATAKELGLLEAVERASKSADENATATKRMVAATEQVDDSVNKASTAIGGLDRALEQSRAGFNAFEQIAIGAFRRVGEVAVNAMADAARGLASFVASSISVAGDYEATLNEFAAVTGEAIGDAGLSLQKFDELALEMGAKTQFSAAEAAQAMVELAKGGMDPATISAGGLEAALGLAAAGGLDLAKAAEITVKQTQVWKDNSLTAAVAADIMAQAANASTVSVEELGLGMANVGGVAQGIGADFNETVTTLAAISAGFSSASDAGTSLKTFFNRLQPTTKSATEAMRELGILTEDGANLFFDSTGAYLGNANAAELLKKATEGMSEAQRAATLEAAFGSDAQRAALELSKLGAGGINQMTVAMEKQGTAADQAAKRNQGFNFAFESLKGSVENLQIVIGKGLNPILESLINKYLIPGVNALGELFQVIIGGIPSIEEFGGIASDTFDAFRGMKHGGEAIDAIGESFDTASARANLAFEKIEAIVTNFAGKDIGKAFRGMAESAAAAFGSLGKLFEGTGGAIMNAAKGIALDVINAMSAVFEGVNIFAGVLGGQDVDAFEGSFLGDAAATIANFAYDIREGFKLVTNIFTGDDITAAFSMAFLTMSKNFGGFGPVIADVAMSFRNLGKALFYLADYFSFTWETGDELNDTLTEFPKSVRPIIQGFGKALTVFQNFGRYILAIVEDGDTLNDWLTHIPGLLQPVAKAVGTFVAQFGNWEAVKGAIMGVGAVLAGGVIYSAIVAIGSALAALASPIALVIGGAALLGAAWNTNFMGIQETTASVWGYVVGAFNTAVGYLSGVFGPVITAFQAFGSGALQEIINFVTGTETEFGNLSKVLSSIVTAVGVILTDIVGAVILYYPQWIAAWLGMMVAAAQWIWNAIPIAIANLESFLGYLVQWIANSLPTWINNLLTWGIALVQWIGDAIPPMITKLGEFLQTLITWATTETQPTLQKEATSWGEILYKWVNEVLIPQIGPKLKEFQEEVVKALKSVAKAAVEQAKKIASQIIDGIVSSLRDGIARVQNAIAELFGAAEATGQEATESHSPSQVFMRIGQNMISGLTQGLQTGNAMTGLTDTFNTLITFAQTVLGQWTAILAKYGQEAWMWLTRALPILQAQIRSWGSTLITALGTNLPLWVMSLTPWSVEAWQWLQRSIVPLTGQMLLFTTLLQMWANSVVLVGLRTSATAWSMALYEWIPNELIPGIQPMWEMFLIDSINNMKRIEAEMYKSGKNVGKAIIKGTLEAIKDGKGKIIMLFIEVINQAIAAAKRELGIASPSLVFYDIGQQIMFGLRDGIIDGTNAAAQALANATGSLSGVVSVTALPGSDVFGLKDVETVDRPLNPNTVSTPATPTQIANRTANSNSYSNTNNYNLTVNTPRTSQGVRNDFQIARAAGF